MNPAMSANITVQSVKRSAIGLFPISTSSLVSICESVDPSRRNVLSRSLVGWKEEDFPLSFALALLSSTKRRSLTLEGKSEETVAVLWTAESKVDHSCGNDNDGTSV